jgi:ATP-dependent RNA helicase RhlE
MPAVPETYVHRIGRTARAGTSGFAASFCSREERGQLRQIERLIRRTVTVAHDQPEYGDANVVSKPPEKNGHQAFGSVATRHVRSSDGRASQPRRTSRRPNGRHSSQTRRKRTAL